MMDIKFETNLLKKIIQSLVGPKCDEVIVIFNQNRFAFKCYIKLRTRVVVLKLPCPAV